MSDNQEMFACIIYMFSVCFPRKWVDYKIFPCRLYCIGNCCFFDNATPYFYQVSTPTSTCQIVLQIQRKISIGSSLCMCLKLKSNTQLSFAILYYHFSVRHMYRLMRSLGLRRRGQENVDESITCIEVWHGYFELFASFLSWFYFWIYLESLQRL